eukprot:403339444
MYLESNKREVLALYRELLKAVIKNMPRKLEREAKLAEFRYLFRELSRERDPDQINEHKMMIYTILDRIENGLYPPFPKPQMV